MIRSLLCGCAMVLSLASVAQAAPTIINLSANGAEANAGPASYQTYATPNPISITLAAGNYDVSVVGIAGGGIYDGFSIYNSNNSYSNGWHYSIGNGSDNRIVTGSNYATAALALAAYAALTPARIVLASAQTVNFYLNDGASYYFMDDSGGVSLALTAVPEPATLALMGFGLGAVAFLRHRRRGV